MIDVSRKYRMVIRSRCFFCIVLFIVAACSSGGEGTFHEGMFGVWKTEEPRYRSSYMEIEKKRIIFYNSEQGVDIYHISRIESIPEGNRILYHIHYKNNEGLEYLLSLFFMHTAQGDYIRFKNQMEFQWSKKKESLE